MAEVPKDLLAEIQHLEEIFTVDTTKLKSITEHFNNELTKGMWFFFRGPPDTLTKHDTGLTVEGGSIVGGAVYA